MESNIKSTLWQDSLICFEYYINNQVVAYISFFEDNTFMMYVVNNIKNKQKYCDIIKNNILNNIFCEDIDKVLFNEFGGCMIIEPIPNLYKRALNYTKKYNVDINIQSLEINENTVNHGYTKKYNN